MYSPKEIGGRIKSRRDELDMTLDEVASKVGVSKSTIQRYENGLIGRIKLPVIESIADALWISPDWLIGVSEEKTARPEGRRSFPIGSALDGIGSPAYRRSEEDAAGPNRTSAK